MKSAFDISKWEIFDNYPSHYKAFPFILNVTSDTLWFTTRVLESLPFMSFWLDGIEFKLFIKKKISFWMEELDIKRIIQHRFMNIK